MIFDPERQAITFEALSDKDAFFEQAGQIIKMLSQEDYRALSEGSGIPDTIAQLDYQRETLSTYHDLVIYINESKFDFAWMTPELRHNVIQVVLRHEFAEFWYIYELRQHLLPTTPVDANDTPHHQALLEEWRLAFELECHEEYFGCIQHWAEETRIEEGDEVADRFLYENVLAYALVAEEQGLDPVPLLPQYYFDY